MDKNFVDVLESIQQYGLENPIEIDNNDILSGLIPQVDLDETSPDYEKIKELERLRAESIGMQSLPEEVFNQVLETCFKQGGYRGFRDALYFTVQANWGVRCSDARIIKYIDFINENGKFRESCLFSEIKTGKSRTMYINEAIKKCVLMLLWNGNFEPLDYLIRSNGNNKNYRKAIDPNTGKVLRTNGKEVYVLDENGNKIPEPLTGKSIREIMTKKLVDDLGIQLKRHKECKDGKFKYATHSIRKLYANKINEEYIATFGEEGRAKIDGMRFVQWDLVHSSPEITARYCESYPETKKILVMKMNLGLEVINKYFEIEKAKYLSSNK